MSAIILLVSGCTKSSSVQKTSDTLLGIDALNTKTASEKDLAIAAAKDIWRIKNLEGINFSSGPCLSNSIIPGWVADISHNPRQEIDNDPKNQCSAYRDGTAKHFVELDSAGNLIQAK
jgi:hypothetical protein